MNLKKLVLTLLILIPINSNAQDATAASNRLQLYKSFQEVCALLVLANHELAVNLTVATKTPLSHLCECASLHTVSGMSDQAITAFSLASDVQVIKTLRERFKNCALIY